MRLLLLLLAHSLLPPRAAARGPPPLVCDFLPSGAYKVVVDGDVWFASDDTFVHVGGKRYSLRAGTLTLQRTDTTTGHDTLGAFTQTNLALKARSTPPVSVMFAVKAWADGETLQFIQSFPDGLPASQSPELDAKNGVSTAFPSWRPATLVGKPRGWVAYDGWDCAKDGGAVGCMKQDVAPAGHVAYGRWSNDTTQLPGGLEGSGPMAIFTADLTRTVVVSAFTNTMASSQVFAHGLPPLSPPPGPPLPLNFTAHPGTWCVGNDPQQWSSNNISLAGCMAEASKLHAAGSADGFDWSPVPGTTAGPGSTCGGKANCAQCRVGMAGKPHPTTQHYTCYALPNGDGEGGGGVTGTPGVLQYGLLGSVTEVPAGWNSSVILSLSKSGPSAAIRSWGAKLLRFYNKDPLISRQDIISTHLGFDTDNGAYYYYHPEAKKTYAETLLDVHAYAVKVGLPYRHVQIDSWWYQSCYPICVCGACGVWGDVCGCGYGGLVPKRSKTVALDLLI